MANPACLERLRRGLRQLLRARALTLAEASAALGRHPNYLSRCLSGQLALKVDEVLALLAVAETAPEDFFPPLFPFGRRLDGVPGGPLPEAVRTARAAPAASPREFTERVRQALKVTLRRRRWSQRRVSLALGLRPHTLSLALSANTRITWELVCGALAASGASAGRFVLDLFAEPDGDPHFEQQWASHLDELEELLGELDEA